MRRLGNTARAILGGGIFLVLAAILIAGYSQQSEEQDRLSMELSAVQILLAKQWDKFAAEDLPARQNELESQLAPVESQLNTAKAGLRQPIESIDITDALFKIAETSEVAIVEISNVAIVELTPPSLIEEDLDEPGFSALSLTVKIEGEIANLVDFISELDEQFPTTVHEVTKINAAESLATLAVQIFNYEGD